MYIYTQIELTYSHDQHSPYKKLAIVIFLARMYCCLLFLPMFIIVIGPNRPQPSLTVCKFLHFAAPACKAPSLWPLYHTGQAYVEGWGNEKQWSPSFSPNQQLLCSLTSNTEDEVCLCWLDSNQRSTTTRTPPLHAGTMSLLYRQTQ